MDYVDNTNTVDYKKIFNRAPAPGNFEQCYAFSIHKAGSTLMHKMIGEACNAANIPALSIPDTLFREGLIESTTESVPGLEELLLPGRVYYGFRFLSPFVVAGDPRLRQRPVVLLVRDPRDALVSQYYSYGGKYVSHRLPDKNKEQFLERAQKTADLGIDDYVLQAAPNYHRKLDAYRRSLDLSSILLRKYEDIYFDKPKFLKEIFDTFRLDVPVEIIDRVARDNDVRPEVEQLGKHVRKGAPGDHREKLQPKTIARLNEIFREIGLEFGYNLP